MKNKILVLILLLVLILSCVSVAIFAGVSKDNSDIDKLLAPYQEIIDKVNAELGSDIYIPEDEKENVYNYYKDMTLEEFEQVIREEMEGFIANYGNEETDNEVNKVE